MEFLGMDIDLESVSSVATAIGVFVMTWSVVLMQKTLKESRAIEQSSFEENFDVEYRKLARAIPVDALIGKEVPPEQAYDMREYGYNLCDLSNEQAWLRSTGRIRKATWLSWSAGMKANFAKIEFKKVWDEVYAHSPETFTYLARLIEDDFKTDPKSWD
jgi:hypothetical protein